MSPTSDIPDAVPPPASASPAPAVDEGWRERLFGAFAVENFRWFFFGQGVSLVGSWMRTAAQAWLVYEITGSKTELGLVAALSQLPLVLFSPLAGTLADRVDKRRLLMGLSVFAAALSIALGVLALLDVVEPWHVRLIAFLSGVEMACEIPVRQSFVVEMVGRRHLTNAIALNSFLFNTARVVGPALAGLLMGLVGPAICFLLDGASFGAVLVALARIRPRRTALAQEEGGWFGRLRAGFRYVRDERRTRILIVLLGIGGVFGWSFMALMPAFAKDVLSLGAGGYGLLYAAMGAGAATGALWVAGRAAASGMRLRHQVFGSIWLSAVMVVAFSQAPNAWLAGGALVLAGFGMLGFVSASNGLIQDTVPDALRGRVMGIWALVFGGTTPLGAYLLGHAAEAWGPRPAVAASGGACLLLSAAVYLRMPPPPRPPAR